MRSILKYTPLRQFSSNKLSQVIQHTAQNLKQQQSNNFVKYQDVFFKLYTSHLAKQKKLGLNVRKLDALCMLGQFPCKSIVEHFHATAKSYSEEYTVQTFVRLSRAYKISQSDNASTADYSINRLFFTPAFQNLIEEYKFGLRKQNAMTWDNALLVAECLIDIGFVDYEVFSILLNSVEARLNRQQRNDTQIRKFQMEKKDYYIGNRQNTQQNLSNDPQFQAVLKMLSNKVREHEIYSRKQQNLKQLHNELSSTQQSQAIYHSILETISLIESYNQNLTKLIEGVITIRKQYRRMTELSQTKDILRNPELNLELLQLQQMLLLKKLISISDVKNSQRIDNEQIELKRVEQILISMIEPERLQISSTDLSEFLSADYNQGENKQTQKVNKLKQISEYGRAMVTLSRFVQVSRRLYNAPDARSLISMKWEKTLLLWNQGGQQTKQWRQNLHAEKIFRRTFADLYKMMKRSYSIFMFTIIEAPLRYKLQFFDSLTRIGYQTELIHLLQNQDLSKQKVETYSNQEFVSLIKILNEIGYKLNADNLKRSTLKHLKRLYDESEVQETKSIFTMQFCTNAANFICQNFNVHSADLVNASPQKDDIQVLYQNLINRLAEQAKYFDQSQNFLTNDHLYEALRVLALQRSGQFKLSKNWFARFNIDLSNKKQIKQFLYRKNPFHSIIEQLCDQYATSPLKDHPFIQTGFNQKGQLTAILLCSSDQSSMDGKNVNGNTGAYIHRIKRQLNISITPLNVNSLLQIDYDKVFQNQEFAFKSKDQIARILKNLFKRDELHLLEFSRTLVNITLVLEKHYKRSYMYALTKFLNTINECVSLYEKEKEILSFQLFRYKRYRLMVQLDTLKQDYSLIDKSVKEELEKLWKKESLTSSSQFFRKNSNILSVVEGIQQLIISSVDNKAHQTVPFTKNLFEGKRFSIETFIENNVQKQNIGVQFINPTTFIDKSFCPYNDWSKALLQVYPLDTIKLNESSNIIKILAKKFLPNVKEEITLLPYAKRETLKNRSQFNINSLQPLSNQPLSQQSGKHSLNVSQKHLQQIKQLLSFVHQLKMSKSEEQLIDYIFSFDFISNFNQKPTQKSHASPLPRDNFSYFNYLEGSNNKLYLESPNLEYLLNKLQQREQIYQILSTRKQKRAEVKIEYQLANISRKDFIKKCQQIDDQIIAKLQVLDKNILDNVDEYKFFENGLKMIKIEKDQRQLERVLNRARYYYRNLDKDFIHVKGNIQRCLKIKRNKAERTLSLYKSLYKIAKGDTQLTENDKQVLKKQASLISYRLENKKDHLDTFSEKFTTLSIGDLSKSDKQRLRLGGSNLSRFSQLPLTDLVLQLVNLLDPKVYENFQKSIVKKFYATTHDLPEQLFSSSLNKQFTQLAHQQERQMINESSKLGFYEMGILNEMVQTFKTQSKSGKQRFAQIYESFYDDIGQMNQSQARVELITQYLNQKEQQYTEQYNPKLISEIKETQVMKLWNVLFKTTYNQSDSELIRKTVSKLCQRIRIMGDHAPPFFGLLVIKILQHPQTDILSKQNLISTLSHFKTPISIDSQDIRLLGQACSKEQKQLHPCSKRLIEQMGQISNKNFMEKLNKKINMIV